jgi:cell division protein FtsB
MAEMNTWAKNWEVTDDPFIKGLNEAVQQNNDLGMWSSLDPTQLLPDMPDQTTIFHHIGNVLALFRNVLVFLPVAITWQAIAKATDAYTKWFPANDPSEASTEKNFLDFWANGYGVLPNRYTLPHIGILDFWIIIAIILISLTSSALIGRGDKANDKLRQVFENERLNVAIRIRRALHGKREASPESIATSLADALADLNQTTRDMAEVAARLEASTTGVMSLTPQIEKLNDHAGTFAMQTSTAIAQAVQQLVASVDSLNGSVSTNITSAFQAAVSSLQEVGEEMKRHSTTVEYGTKLLKDDIEEIRKGLRR